MAIGWTRRDWMRGTLGTAAFAGLSETLAKAAARPNVILIVSDDQGFADLGCYGAKDIRTPHLDALAARGVRFTRYYANAPECTPTRTALLTGRYQQRVGGLECAIGVGNVGRYDEAVWLQERGLLGLPPTENELVRALKNAGYATACFGKWHLGYEGAFHPLEHGFDRYVGPMGGAVNYFTHKEPTGEEMLYRGRRVSDEDGYLTDLIAKEATAWIRQQSGPYFVYLPFTAPHTPYQSEDDQQKEITEANWNRGDRKTYARMVERLDWAVGQVLRAAAERGQPSDTLIIFASDNGGTGPGDNAPYRGRKGQLFEGGIRVPCMIAWPGSVPEGKTFAIPAMTMDLTATVLAACGATPARSLDGENLLPWIRDEWSAPAERRVFFRYKRLQNRRRAVMEGDWKYLWDNGDEYLFNLGPDPSEKNNLIAQQPERAEAMKQHLATWEMEVRAPRLREFPG